MKHHRITGLRNHSLYIFFALLACTLLCGPSALYAAEDTPDTPTQTVTITDTSKNTKKTADDSTAKTEEQDNAAQPETSDTESAKDMAKNDTVENKDVTQDNATQDTQERNVVIYQPENCEFAIALPEEPYTTRRCHPNMPEKCDLMTSFTQVFGLSTTLNFYISCKPVSTDVAEQFTQDVMQTTLIARAGTRLDASESAYQEVQGGKARVAILMGSGKNTYNGEEELYVSQIWVGQHSIMTIESEINGQSREDADKMLSSILRSVHLAKDNDTDGDNASE
ncbi:MAG: hypothetical protein QF692_04375 [Alphaproteobacteria bacterium]|nr:hypothetical protein [Alphaproteobacteria bacterium]MDP7222484.1 hypothetical protein [Alphaproteobacteria bacterium]